MNGIFGILGILPPLKPCSVFIILRVWVGAPRGGPHVDYGRVGHGGRAFPGAVGGGVPGWWVPAEHVK